MFRALLTAFSLLSFTPAALADSVRVGAAAFGDWRDDAPGVVRHITLDSLPPSYATHSAARPPAVVARPVGATLRVPPLGALWLRYSG